MIYGIICIISVSIPLRKFPRRAWSPGRWRRRLVSIPLRKFPRHCFRASHSRWTRCFHSTKEVSKGLRGLRRRARPGTVSIPLRKFPRGVDVAAYGTDKTGFHSTKEVSKVAGGEEWRACYRRVSIPLRKFPRKEYVEEMREEYGFPFH